MKSDRASEPLPVTHGAIHACSLLRQVKRDLPRLPRSDPPPLDVSRRFITIVLSLRLSRAVGRSHTGMFCASCAEPIRQACLVAACGHAFHEVCAESLCGDRKNWIACPECDGATIHGELWRTYWECDGSSQAASSADDTSISDWRRVVRLERQLEDACLVEVKPPRAGKRSD